MTQSLSLIRVRPWCDDLAGLYKDCLICPVLILCLWNIVYPGRPLLSQSARADKAMASRLLPILSGRSTQLILGCLTVVVFCVLVVALRRRQTSQIRQEEPFTRVEVTRRATPRLRVAGGRPYTYAEGVVELREGRGAPLNQLGLGGTIIYELGVVRTTTPPPWL